MPNVDWIQSANLSRAVSSHTLVYEISANNTYADREAVIVFKDANNFSRSDYFAGAASGFSAVAVESAGAGST
ncbi:BACON domain-containing protein [Alistipes shahii]|uniref:BACON domain-containing protein n=1 Tax=Alistipes shahii TaxID=328814 RepID=UPI0034A0C860